ncbi:TniQ family protein [Iodobacter fluviatilis]|uniref:TniQ protein n=1 Tax=Iodobacter fluviatilis TaxID=537 RepID=A0A377STV4_9NEIS|nr:TniQ family protein [Iodobacter fluviatilis]TCU81620.1 TniQ protein [Iodobacter fluviatilis]STR44780.1 Uncharacterised protein [Iodobacter fluviatilis]
MFLLRPHPLPFESLSSWRQRAGFANGFWRYPQPHGPKSQADPDRLPKVDEQLWLSQNFQIELNRIGHLTLDSELALLQNHQGYSTQLHWQTILGAKDRQHSSGPVFCPECLKSDPIPYFRLHWRFAFLTECPEHNIELLESCPKCASHIWPATVKNLSQSRPWSIITSCPQCGFDLRNSRALPYNAHTLATTFWSLITTEALPQSVSQIHTRADFFEGLWVLCQFLLRKPANSVWDFIPIQLHNKLPFYLEKKTLIEEMNINHRREVIQSAYWLMEEWPERFLFIAKRVGLTSSMFSPTANYSPSWLTSLLDSKLTRSKKIICINDVNGAIFQIAQSGKLVSKKAVRNLLGIKESRIVDTLISRRNRATLAELKLLLGKFEYQMAICPNSRDQKASLTRDYLILLLSVLKRIPIEGICSQSEEDILETLSTAAQLGCDATGFETLLKEQANNLNDEYKKAIRPKFLVEEKLVSHWFIGREGKHFAGHTLRARIAKMMQQDFPHDLWKSCDSFIYTLGPAPVSRRQLQRNKIQASSQ